MQRIKDDLRIINRDRIAAYSDHILSQKHSVDWKARFLLCLKKFYTFLFAGRSDRFQPHAPSDRAKDPAQEAAGLSDAG